MHLLAATVLIIWIALFIQTLINLRVVRKLRRDAMPDARPLVSIVVPARNEARVIERSIRSFLAQDYDNFEVIVVNDRSTDATGTILRSIADRRLTVIDGAETPAGWLGKPWALEQGRVAAKGELLLFADADLIYAPEAIRAAVAAIESQKAALITLFPNLEMRTFGEHVGMPMIAFFGLSVLPLWLSNRWQVTRLAMGGGSGNLVWRSAFESFTPLKDAVIDDIGLAKLVRRHGGITRALRADELISVRMYHSGGELAEGFTKNLFAGLDRSYSLGVSFLALFAAVNLLPYAVALTGDAFAIAAIVLISVTRAALFWPLRYRLDNAIFLHPLMVAFWAYIFLRSMWFTGVRNELRWRGRTYDAAQTRGV